MQTTLMGIEKDTNNRKEIEGDLKHGFHSPENAQMVHNNLISEGYKKTSAQSDPPIRHQTKGTNVLTYNNYVHPVTKKKVCMIVKWVK